MSLFMWISCVWGRTCSTDFTPGWGQRRLVNTPFKLARPVLLITGTSSMALLKLTDWNFGLHLVFVNVDRYSRARVKRVACVGSKEQHRQQLKLSNMFVPNPEGLQCGKSLNSPTGIWQQGHQKTTCATPFPTSPSAILSRVPKLKRRKQRHRAAELPRAYENQREQNSETKSVTA